jgi:hypothetical protein
MWSRPVAGVNDPKHGGFGHAEIGLMGSFGFVFLVRFIDKSFRCSKLTILKLGSFCHF